MKNPNYFKSWDKKWQMKKGVQGKWQMSGAAFKVIVQYTNSAAMLYILKYLCFRSVFSKRWQSHWYCDEINPEKILPRDKMSVFIFRTCLCTFKLTFSQQIQCRQSLLQVSKCHRIDLADFSQKSVVQQLWPKFWTFPLTSNKSDLDCYSSK